MCAGLAEHQVGQEGPHILFVDGVAEGAAQCTAALRRQQEWYLYRGDEAQ